MGLSLDRCSRPWHQATASLHEKAIDDHASSSMLERRLGVAFAHRLRGASTASRW